MNGGQSSTQATRESMSFAYAARACADLLACFLTCEVSNVLNSCNPNRVPDTIVEIDIGALVGSASAWHTIRESDSKMMSYSPMSLANIVASSKAFASASKGPKGSGMRLLMAATTEPP